VRRFLDCLQAQSLQVDWWQSVETGPGDVAAAVMILSAARTALILTAPCAPDSLAASHLRTLLLDLRERAKGSGVRLMQALLVEDGDGQSQALQGSGFRRLARLLYMARPSAPCPAVGAHLTLEPYCHERHDLFVRTLAETYIGSLDCPALSELRSMDDVLASHRATGLHDPKLWHLASDGDGPAGVLLLTRPPLRSALEIIYLGVVPRARGRGLGRTLVRAAVHRAHLEGRREVLLAVDAGNRYAVDVYSSLEFVQTDDRYAWIQALPEVV
jgi:ribosomal protein S18 acetylase RimI-like enzyme